MNHGFSSCSAWPPRRADFDKGGAGREGCAADRWRPEATASPGTSEPRSPQHSRPPQTAEGVPGHAAASELLRPLWPRLRVALRSCGTPPAGLLAGVLKTGFVIAFPVTGLSRPLLREADRARGGRREPERTWQRPRSKVTARRSSEVLGCSQLGSWVKQLVLIALCQARSRSKQTQLTKKPA